MYTSSPVIPAAATGLMVASVASAWLGPIYAFCAVFALIGAVMAIRRTLPVPSFVQGFRAKRTNAKLRISRINRSRNKIR